MEILNLVQSSPDWHAARKGCFCASEAAAAMGLSKYQTRDELLHQKHTGLAPEVDAAKQRLFDAGHAAEAGARAIAEQIADTEFAPLVGVETINGMPLLASFDGIDMMGETLWENKLWSQSLVAQVEAGELLLKLDQAAVGTESKTVLQALQRAQQGAQLEQHGMRVLLVEQEQVEYRDQLR